MTKLFSATGLFCIFLLLAGTGGPFETQDLTQRKTISINADWAYLEKDLPDITALYQQHTSSTWDSIDLPHTWNRWDAIDYLPGYRRSASWYRKKLQVPEYQKARYILAFEGVNMSAEVYVNQQLAGKHIGGYIGFEIDITAFVQRGVENTLDIRVDNRFNPDLIPSQKSDFFIYGGITRDVWLHVVPETYLQHAFVSTPKVNAKQAETSVRVDLANPTGKAQSGVVTCALLDPETGQVVARKMQSVQLNTPSTTATIALPLLKNPKLWSPDHPHLYTLQIHFAPEGNEPKDTLIERVGYRWFHFDPNGPFYLNGERLLIRGTHRHEDYAGYGPAMPNALHREDMRMIKEMGANFVRLGHYPQDPEVYKACDELGLIVWDELPWCRGGKGGQAWEANTRRLLNEQITQNYNHPSILFWSLGNEIYWLPDFPGGDDTTQLNAFLATLHQDAHQLDPYRMTALRKYYEGAHLVDVFSPSIWSGWYAGVYKNYEKTLAQERTKYKNFLHMEYGGDSHVGRHSENPITGAGSFNADDWTEQINQANVQNIAQEGDWSESYIVDLFDWYLGISETSDWFGGNAQWAFKDFGTPLRPENPIPYINQKGLLDRSGKPKDAYYVFKSYWAKQPFVYIESHTWTERSGQEGKARNIPVFSNCSTVELEVNGISLGSKTRKVGVFPACGLNWDVLFKEGKNQLIARGYVDGKEVHRDTLHIQYSFQKHGNPYDITLRSQPLPNGNILIEALMEDAAGRRVLDYEKRVYFHSDGAGTLLINYGTPTRSHVVEMANGRAAIELVPGKGKTVVEVRNQDFKGSYITIEP